MTFQLLFLILKTEKCVGYRKFSAEHKAANDKTALSLSNLIIYLNCVLVTVRLKHQA